MSLEKKSDGNQFEMDANTFFERKILASKFCFGNFFDLIFLIEFREVRILNLLKRKVKNKYSQNGLDRTSRKYLKSQR